MTRLLIKLNTVLIEGAAWALFINTKMLELDSAGVSRFQRWEQK